MTQIVLHTASDNRKQLTREVAIVLTLTPKDIDKQLPDNYSPLVWKVLEFPKKSYHQKRIHLETSFGFAIAQQDSLDNDVVVAGDMRAPASFDHVVSWRDGVLEPNEDQASSTNGNQCFRLFNGDYDELTAVLCMIDNSNPEKQVYCPVIHLKDLKENYEHSFPPPIMLQAYAISGYKEGMPLAKSDMKNFLFADAEGKERAIDIRKLTKDSLAVRLYSQPSGQVTTDTRNYDKLLEEELLL